MNKELLRQLQARHEKRLSDLQGKIESEKCVKQI